jgi:CDP-diacylglycerol--serine O-phosphatidyltransferase
MARLFPPFDPDEGASPRLRPRQLPHVPVRLLLPNVVTLLALCAGLTAIRFAIEGNFEIAIYAVLFAAALDGLDGRVARLLRSTSRFGAQLDSLADFVNFGVAPALMLFVWALSDLGSFGWVGGLIFAICVALRLARFNVSLDGPKRPAWQGAYFVGVPAPAGAVIALLPLYIEFLGAPHGAWTAPVTMAYMIVVAILMISRVPTWSGKLIGRVIPRDLVAPLFIVVVMIVGLLFSFTWLALTIGTLAYLATLPLSWRAWHEQMLAAASAPPDAGNVEPLPLRPASISGGRRRGRTVDDSRKRAPQ